jgi:hypothetical protein
MTLAKSNTAKKRGTAKAVPASKGYKTSSAIKAASRSSSSPKNILAELGARALPRAESAMADGLSMIADSLGFKKLEDVFDQRVAAALERIGIPTARELAELRARVDELSALVPRGKTKVRK